MTISGITRQSIGNVLLTLMNTKAVFMMVCLALVGIGMYVPFASSTLYHDDSVGFALAIHDYNLRLHQPGAPGYPLYVLALRIFQGVTGASDNDTLVRLNIAATVISALIFYRLAKFWIRPSRALLLALLLLTSPVVWFNAEIAMSYPLGMLASLGVAFIAYQQRAGNVVARYLTPMAWGLAAGFRQELGVILAPLVIYSAHHQWLKSKRYALVFCALALAGFAPWLLFLINHLGGVRTYYEYVRNVASVGNAWSSLRQGAYTQGTMLAVKNGSVLATFALLGCLGVLPLQVLRLRRRTASVQATDWVHFLSLWALPGILLHLFTTIGHSGYILSYLPGLLLLGALPVLTREEQRGTSDSKLMVNHMFVFGFVLQAMFFLLWPQATGTLSGIWLSDTLFRRAGGEPTRSGIAHADDTIEYLRREIKDKYPAAQTLLIVPVGDELPRQQTIRAMFAQARYYLPTWEQRVLYTTPLNVFTRLSMPDSLIAEVKGSKFDFVSTNVIHIPGDIDWLVWFCDTTTQPYAFDESWTTYALHPGVNIVMASVRDTQLVRHWGPFEFRKD